MIRHTVIYVVALLTGALAWFAILASFMLGRSVSGGSRILLTFLTPYVRAKLVLSGAWRQVRSLPSRPWFGLVPEAQLVGSAPSTLAHMTTKHACIAEWIDLLASWDGCNLHGLSLAIL